MSDNDNSSRRPAKEAGDARSVRTPAGEGTAQTSPRSLGEEPGLRATRGAAGSDRPTGPPSVGPYPNPLPTGEGLRRTPLIRFPSASVPGGRRPRTRPTQIPTCRPS